MGAARRGILDIAKSGHNESMKRSASRIVSERTVAPHTA